jgi:RHS repeat-associated protein
VNGSTQYAYDAEGRRVAKLNSSGVATNIYVLGLGGEQVTEQTISSGSASIAHRNVYAGGKLLATYDGNSIAHLQLDDWLGTRRMQVRAFASSDGKILAGTEELGFQSLPFGDSLATVTYMPGSTDPTEQHFTGKERDTESGLDYFGARYNSSSMGRFMSPDWSAGPSTVPYAKLTNPQTLNLYAYVGNNPMSVIDPDGHFWQELNNWVHKREWKKNDPPQDTVTTEQHDKGVLQQKQPFTVTLNSRQANIPGGQVLHDTGVNHEWITTRTGTSTGMGTAQGVPQSDAPGVETQVVDHTGQVPTSTATYTNVDETAINAYLKAGTPTGRWIPGVNDCNTWAANAIAQSTPHDIRSGPTTVVRGVVVIEAPVIYHNVVVYADGSIHQPGEN